MYDLFLLTKPAILGDVGTTFISFSDNTSSTDLMNLSSKLLSLIVSGTTTLVKNIFLSCSAYSMRAKESLTFVSNCLKNLRGLGVFGVEFGAWGHYHWVCEEIPPPPDL